MRTSAAGQAARKDLKALLARLIEESGRLSARPVVGP
jgi:hypothetical protein